MGIAVEPYSRRGLLWSVYSMTEQQSYSSSTHFANAKVYFVIENEQSSEGTEESGQCRLGYC